MPPAAVPLQRHQLAYLSDAGWQRQLAAGGDGAMHDCLAYWSAQRLPLVVATQPPRPAGTLALGLPAPGRWGRCRLALRVARTEILYFDAFPPAPRARPLLPAGSRAAWDRLCGALADSGAPARIYGSHGWQLITGLDHLRPGSDADLCIAVSGPAQADAVAERLRAFPEAPLRLDGEIMFPDGAAVAWREWSAWRAGRTASVLVKRIGGAHIAHGAFWPVRETAAEAAP
ncbi:malonate decarboxylase holo-[acyl-carrier-protein] synthase [Paracidovorax anthurii]|uniref:Phosphoribosyl-dephospho-CoA transferase n=1 Tax=Paracidovorax anthurii TaxID=78229 RepID=A0A328YVL1_9BURK|nr:malonate decarboxylase holo-[acyl-carrier-protein] synthase [Paracidovorax anthurii]RAR78008.1 phosphoribosyl-dephospho-CoA transferase [Paracidovorax anthurii]